MTTPVLIYLYHTGKEDTHMEKRNETVVKLAQTALMAALCFVSFTFLQIKIPLPGETLRPSISAIPSACSGRSYWAAGTADWQARWG